MRYVPSTLKPLSPTLLCADQSGSPQHPWLQSGPQRRSPVDTRLESFVRVLLSIVGKIKFV
jgi:hypothetical protein